MRDENFVGGLSIVLVELRVNSAICCEMYGSVGGRGAPETRGRG